MSYITLKCKNCGGNMSLNTESNSATCTHCGSTFLIADILDEKDIAFKEKFTPVNIQQKMLCTDAIKQGETFLYQTEYEKAELSFKKAIELDENNYKGYLGVVKAKTRNLNTIPEDDDYIQYANYALSLAQGDEIILVKSELAKIELLKHENIRNKKIKAQQQKQNEIEQKRKKGIARTFSLIAIFFIVIFIGFILISSVIPKVFFNKATAKKSIEISNYQELKQVFESNKYLNYEIKLTKNIDCNNNIIPSLGDQYHCFTGIFNGNNHTISNALIDDTEKEHFGLFGYTKQATIKNLVLDNVDLKILSGDPHNTTKSFGILAGKTEYTDIYNIEIKDTCDFYIERVVGDDRNCDILIGGMIGSSINSSNISSISCHAKLSCRIYPSNSECFTYIGGVVGQINNTIIKKTCSNCDISIFIFSTYDPNGNTQCYASGIIGNIKSISNEINYIENNLFSGKINCNTFNVDCFLGAISGTNINATTKKNNYCLYNDTSFKIDGAKKSVSSLCDFTTNPLFLDFCASNNEYISKITDYFPSWKNCSTFMPTIS